MHFPVLRAIRRLQRWNLREKHWSNARVLIDESLPRQLVSLLIGHDAKTVQAEGWSAVKNGELLLSAVAARFEVFVTPDRKLEYQQNIPRVGLAIVVIRAFTNRIEDVAPLVPRVLEVLPEVRAGTVTHIGV